MNKSTSHAALDITALARIGAKAQLDSILAMFPDLAPGAAKVRGVASATPTGARRKAMSATERKAVSKRMKAYWAKRRAAKGNGNGR